MLLKPKTLEEDEFITDEEELSKETNWIIQKRNPKKRKAESSPEIESPTSKPLKSKEKPIQRPPPIMITGVEDYKALYSLIKNHTKLDFNIKLLNNNIYKINVLNSDDYRTVTAALNIEKTSWYSYENKQSRPIKIVIKNLHHSWSSEDIVSYLQAQNLKAISAINMLKYKTKEPLDMFLVSFDSSEDIKRIYELKTILNTIIKIEPPKQSKWIPQCKSCQGFNHTKNYCSKPPRCVKCAGKHRTEECDKPEKEKPKCVNCGEDHPANYRGCLVAKELQKLRKKQTKRQINTNKSVQAPPPSIKVDPGISYAKITAKNPKKADDTTTQDVLSQILQQLKKQEQFNNELEKRLSKLEDSLKRKAKSTN